MFDLSHFCNIIRGCHKLTGRVPSSEHHFQVFGTVFQEAYQFAFLNGSMVAGGDNFIQNQYRFYVNSWGRDKTQIIASRVGAESPARFLCTAEEDSVSEITEVTYPEADPLQDFGLVVAALNKAI